MTDSAPTEHLRAAVETAQSVTAGIGDPQLRGIAFGKVLAHLLANSLTPTILPRTRSDSKPAPISRPGPRPAANGPTAWISSLRDDGFFSSPKSLGDITEAVCAQGHTVESKYVTAPLEKLVLAKVLKRERKPAEGQKRGVWLYVNA
jgi:hypothetical protein